VAIETMREAATAVAAVASETADQIERLVEVEAYLNRFEADMVEELGTENALSKTAVEQSEEAAITLGLMRSLRQQVEHLSAVIESVL
jgi:hypothetical protein